jgi:hypothetical protein
MKTIWNLKSEWSLKFSNEYPKNIIIGSSRTLALNPNIIYKSTHKKFLNLSLPSAQIPYVYYTIKRLFDSNIKIKTIYIDIPASNNMHNGELLKGAFNQNFIRYFLTKNELKEYSIYNKYALEHYNNTRFYGKDFVNKDLSKLLIGNMRNIVGGDKNLQDIETLTNNYGYALIGNKNRSSNNKEAIKYREIVNTKTNRFNIPTIQLIYMENLLTLLKKNNNIKYKFFFSPYPNISSNYDNLGMGNYIKLLSMIPKENIHTNILLLDSKYFSDGSHPNLKGSTIFNEYFIQEVLGIPLKKPFDLFYLKI